MKKLISILLVAMLIIGMFPATALTAKAAEATATLSFASTAQRTSYSTSQQIWKQNGITLTNDKSSSTSNVGNYSNPARFYKSSKLTIEYGQAMTKIAFACNTTSYATAMKSSITSGGTVTVSGKIVTVVLTTPATSFVVNSLSGGQVRMDSLTVTYEIATSCNHENTTEQQDGKPATCTEPGLTNSFKCDDCGATTKPCEDIPALGHEYDDGNCVNCGNPMIDPAVSTQATLMTEKPTTGNIIAIYHPTSCNVMTSAADGSALDAILSNVSGNQLPYDGTVAQLVIGVDGDYYTFKTNSGEYLATGSTGGNLFFTETVDDYAKWSITANGSAWNIINKAATDSYGDKAIEYYNGYFTTYGIKSSDTAFSIALYLVGQDTCPHTNTDVLDEVAANCTETGLTEGVQCLDCGAITVAQQTIDALGHNYVNGVCSRPGCGAEEPTGITPVAQITEGEYVIVATTSNGDSYALGNSIDSKITPIEVTLDGTTLVSSVEDGMKWTIEACNTGWALTNGTNYLKYSSSTNFATSSTAYQWNVTAGTNGFKFIASGASTRAIAYGTSQGKFGAYSTTNTSGYVIELALYKIVSEAPAEPVAEVNGTEYTSMDEALEAIAANGGTLKLLANIEDAIAVTGNLTLDLNGKTANVTATGIISAYDSTATVSAAGTGALTTTSTVVLDNTVAGVRYIALNNGNEYTFHELRMKMSAVTLRTNAAGIYYKATVICDPILAAAAESYGVALSTRDLPGDNFAIEKMINGDVNAWTSIKNEGEAALTGKADAEAFTSGSVFDIFKDGADNAARGEIKIYANAYLDLGNGRIVMASNDNWDAKAGTAWSLRDVMEKVDDADLKPEQKTLVADFYAKWSNYMTGWSLDNIKTWTPSTPAA